MSWKKLAQKAVKYSGFGMGKAALKGLTGGKQSEGDPRAEAAKGLIRQDVKRQAGGGQISFTEEKEA